MFKEINKLKELKSLNKEIRVCIIGIGKMGNSLFNQLLDLDGFKPNLIVNRTIEKGIRALENEKVKEYKFTRDFEESERYLAQDKIVLTDDYRLACESKYIDIIVDATGDPTFGAELSLSAIENKKDIVMLNVECDATIGPILRKKAIENGVIYTGTKGDEPGAIIELVEFARSVGLEVLVCAKGKNNKLNRYATNEDLKDEARSKALNTKLLTSFVDGTNTMIEMNAVCNALGFKVDKVGMHGITTNLKDSSKDFSLDGYLNSYGVVDYAFGMAPGVFVVVTSKDEATRDLLKYLGLGDGPNYTLYRPFHLTSLETPISIYKAFIERDPSINAKMGTFVDTVAVSKRDLKKGDKAGYIGSDNAYGLLVNKEDQKKYGYLPIGLLNENTRLKVDVKKDTFLTYDMVDLDKDSIIYKLRKEQDDLGI